MATAMAGKGFVALVDDAEAAGTINATAAAVLRLRVEQGLTLTAVAEVRRVSKQACQVSQCRALDRLGLPRDVVERLLDVEKAARAERLLRRGRRVGTRLQVYRPGDMG